MTSRLVSPTPDVARELPGIRNEDEQYIVQVGDSLGNIAARYEITVQMLHRSESDSPTLTCSKWGRNW